MLRFLGFHPVVLQALPGHGPLSGLIDRIVYGVLGLNASSKAVQAFHFFLYDSVKILLLLFVMIAVIGFLRTFLPRDKVRRWLGRRGAAGYLVAALLGAVTPFCSCSSIPLFLSFLEAGIPLGVTFTFLVASPLINEYLVVLMLGFFGWKITVLYVASGLLIGIVAGSVISRMNADHLLVKDMIAAGGDGDVQPAGRGLFSRARFGVNEAASITCKLWVWVLVGVGIGALIHNYVPQQAIHAIMQKTGVFSVPLAVLLGVPMYGSCAAIVPVAVVLFQKGIPLGTALGFMMATAALSLPEAVMLRRAMRLKLIGIFFGITAVGILLIGYLINIFQGIFV